MAELKRVFNVAKLKYVYVPVYMFARGWLCTAPCDFVLYIYRKTTIDLIESISGEAQSISLLKERLDDRKNKTSVE